MTTQTNPTPPRSPINRSALRRSLAPAALALALLGFAHVAPADTMKVPKEKPVFIIEIPDGWSHKVDKDGDLECAPASAKDNYSLQVISASDVKTKAEMKAALPKLAKSLGEKGGMKDIELGDVEDSKNAQNVPFTGIRADGKSGDVALVVILHAFEPQKGKWYVLLTVGTEETDTAHEKDYDAIFDSISALK